MSAEPSTSLAAFYAVSYERLVRQVTFVAGSRETAEDVVQESFVRLVPRWNAVSAYDDPEAYVRRIAFRLIANRARKLKNGLRALARSWAVTIPEIDGPGDAVDISRAFSTLSVGQRQVVILHDFLGYTIKDIAADLRISEGTVKSRLTRARTALAPLLREDTDHVPSP